MVPIGPRNVFSRAQDMVARKIWEPIA